jgi:hypothetical protein
MQAIGVGGDKGIAASDRLDHPAQPVQNHMIERNGRDAEQGDGAKDRS